MPRRPLAQQAINIPLQLGVQAAGGAGGEYVGALASGQEVRPGAILAEAVGELGGAPMEIAGMRSVSRATREAGRLAADQQSADAAIAHIDAFNRLGDRVAAMKMTPLSPEKTEEALRSIIEDGGPRDVFVPAEKVQEYFQSLPPDEAERTAREWGIYNQIAEALAAGSDVVIPAETYLAKVHPVAGQVFAEDIRLDQGGMSPREAKAFSEAYARFVSETREQLLTDTDAEVKAAEPLQRIHDDVMRQAQMAGFTNDAARQYAALYAARYAARAARLGMADPWALYQQSGIEIRQELPEALRAVPPDQLDLLINALRNKGGKDVASQRTLFGPSLLEFIARRGGIVDTGGELAAMDAGQWHKGKPGMPRLLREDADDSRQLSMGKKAERKPIHPDDVALAAWEAGYFPQFSDRPTVNDLYDAIAEELAGTPRHAADSRRDWRRDYQAALKGLEETLTRLGVDVKTASNAEIKAALRQAGERAEGGYEQPFAGPEVARTALGGAQTVEVDGITRPALTADGRPIPNVLYQTQPLRPSGPFRPQHEIQFQRDLEALKVGALPRGKVLSLGPVPQALQLAGLQDLPFVLKPGEASKVLLEKHKDVTDEATLTRLPRLLADPIMVFVQENGRYGVLIHDTKGNDVLAVIDPRGLVNNRRANVVVSVHPKAHPDMLVRAVAEGRVRYRHKRRSLEWFDQAQRQLPGREPIQGFTGNIATEADLGKSYDQPAWHGSPHVFDRFSTDAIGTGEGAQAYGWGLYFAGRKAVAAWYRRTLSRYNRALRVDGETVQNAGPGWTYPDGREIPSGSIEGLALDAAAYAFGSERSFETAVRHYLWYNGWDEKAAEVFAFLGERRVRQAQPGRLYQVEIPDDGQYLLWEKPLSQQPEAVRAALAQMQVIARPEADPTGEAIYRELSELMALPEDEETAGPPPRGSDDRAASQALLSAGIAGIKYLDQGSRGKGDGSYNYVVFDDSLVQIRSFEQPARGRIAFSEGRSIISLFEGRDLSTLLHETGHLWLEELRADAALASAPQQLRDDWATVQKWLGNAGEPLTVEQHEQFARGFEAYLMEGRAPSVELGGVFARFKAWLISIYRTVANLNVTLDPEIRAVFDRLIATDEQLEAVQTEQQARQLFASADQAGMTEAEFQAYQRSVDRAREKANETLLKKAMGEVRRRRTAEWKREAEAVRAEVQADMNRRPEFMALHFLRTGKMLDGTAVEALRPMKLSAEAIKDMYGAPTALDALPRAVPPIYTDNGGVHPDALAELFGYRSGRDMVDALMGVEAERLAMKAAGDNRSVMRARVDAEVERIMAERHGDMLSDGSIEEEALAAINNDQRAVVLAAELRALARKAGVGATPLEVARRWAQETIARKSVRDGASARAVDGYARAEAKAARAVEAALLAGDTEEAFRQKQQQMLSHVLYVAARQAQQDVEAGQKLMDRYAQARTIKSMDQGYLEQIHALLERFSFRRVSQAEVERRASLREWAQAQQAAGVDVAVPEALLDEAFRQHYTELPIDQFRGLADSVRQIAHLGRLKQKLLDAKEEREFQAVVDEATASMAALPPGPPLNTGRGLTRGQERWQAILDKVRGLDASLLKMETVFDWLDGGKSDGVFNRVVFRRIADAQGKERTLQKQMVGALDKLYAALPKGTADRWQEVLVLPGLPDKEGRPTRLLRSQLIAAALNTGNESNHQKLLKGEGWDADALKAALDQHLTKQDWDFVQGVWDLIDSLWPEIAALERRVNGAQGLDGNSRHRPGDAAGLSLLRRPPRWITAADCLPASVTSRAERVGLPPQLDQASLGQHARDRTHATRRGVDGLGRRVDGGRRRHFAPSNRCEP